MAAGSGVKSMSSKPASRIIPDLLQIAGMPRSSSVHRLVVNVNPDENTTCPDKKLP